MFPPQNQLKYVIKATRADELLEEKQKKMKTKNIIIHVVVENEERRNKTDSDFVENLIDNLVKVEVKYITRLWSSKSGKVRPIKVVFANEKEKFS